MTTNLGSLDGAVTEPSGWRWQSASQRAAIGAHNVPPARPLSVRKSATQPKKGWAA